MALDLLERDAFLCTLDGLLPQAAQEHGRIAVVSGEAGIGKTSVVECFLARHRGTTRVLWGACEALFTPRPLGPLYDIAWQTAAPLRELLAGETNRATLFSEVLDELAQVPTILVVEDIHWADEATLDLLTFLARRIQRTRTLLLLTYRDDEVGREHLLRFFLGELPTREVTRLRLPPLSEGAVAALVGHTQRSAQQLHAITGGNPFFLTETLASPLDDVPQTVADAVLARVARRSPQARRLLEIVAVAPSRLERAIVAALCGGDQVAYSALDECVAARLLLVDEGAVAFRHELARQAVEGALAPPRRQSLHAQVLCALLAHGAEDHSAAPIALAQLVHHAAAAEEAVQVLRLAPLAARQAAGHGAHREAAAHYRTALRYAEHLEAAPRAELLDALTNELFLTGHMDDAEAPCQEALALWRALEQHEHVGSSLRQLSSITRYLGKNAEAERYGMMAVAVLETLPPSRELARAYANLSGLTMVKSDNAQTLLWGERAIALAEQLGDAATLSSALGNMASCELCSGNERGQIKAERSLQLALEHGLERQAAVGYTNLADVNIKHRAYAVAMRYLQLGLAYCAEHDLDLLNYCLLGNRALWRLDQGDWAGADEDLTAILSIPWASVANRIPPLVVLALLRLRRGDPAVEAVLDEVRDLALVTGEMQNISPVSAARAEWRWLQGDRAGCVSEAEVGFRLALQVNRPWYWGEVAIWLWRGGGLSAAPERTPTPYALQISGDWRAAAVAWERLGCPYERALALADGNEAAQRAALDILERLGAAPAAALVRRRLRTAGARGLPRAPRAETRANPRGLTPRQLEVLALLAEGLSNPEIADRLSTTLKTVEHHVSAVLAKIEVRTRAEAVSVAHQLGVVPKMAVADP